MTPAAIIPSPTSDATLRTVVIVLVVLVADKILDARFQMGTSAAANAINNALPATA